MARQRGIGIMIYALLKVGPITRSGLGSVMHGLGSILKTVLLQGHFYSLHLLFASVNKTTFQSRMI